MYLVFRARVPSTRDPSHQESLQHPLSSPPRAATCKDFLLYTCVGCLLRVSRRLHQVTVLAHDLCGQITQATEASGHNFLHIVHCRTSNDPTRWSLVLSCGNHMVRHMTLHGAPKWRGHVPDWNWSCFT